MDRKTINKVIAEKTVVPIASVVFAVGMLVSYGYISMQLDPDIFIDFRFWNPIATIGSIVNIAITSLIIVNANNNYKKRNFFTKVKIENVEILYLMCLPTLVIVIVTIILTTIRNIVTYDCYSYGSSIFALSTSIFFVAVLLLLIETNGLIEYGEEWIINFNNFATVLLTISCLLGYSILNTCIEQANVFKRNINITFAKNTCIKNNQTFSSHINNAWEYLESYMCKSTALFGITCSIFLINPFLRHYKNMNNYLIEEENEINIDRSNQKEKLIKYMILFIFIAMLLLASTISILIPHSNSEIFAFLYHGYTIFTYIMLIWSSIIIINYVKIWQILVGKQRTFNEILISISFCGSLFHCLAMIVTSIYQLYYEYRIFYIITIVKYFTFATQIIFQNVLEKVLLSKNWRNQQEKTNKVVLPLFLFMGMCNGVLVLSNFMHSPYPLIETKNKTFFIPLFVKGFDNIGEIFATLQRLHGTVLFIYLFILIRKDNFN